jgi:aspartate carbamoyltransferase catalytic subunit
MKRTTGELERPTSGQTQPLWRHRHILDLDDFSPDEIEFVLNTADAMREVLSREVRKVPTLRGRTIATLFYEPSTRTRLSFELAAKSLSADVVNLTTPISSVVKGESLIDTIRTLESLGVDILIMRHQQEGAPYLAARHLSVSVINAGDGCHAHPTQALLDIYTIRQRRGRIGGLKVVIIGDIKHSRVARSNIWGLSTMGAQVVLCAPPTLLPIGLEEAFPPVAVEHELERALPEADVVMTLRLQRERQTSGLLPSIREYTRLYQLNEDRLRLAKPDALVLHPGPVNEGVELTPGVACGVQSAIREQVKNGVAVRMALLYLLMRRPM